MEDPSVSPREEVDKLYELGERLDEAKEKSLEDYKGILEAAGGSEKARQLAAQLIPKFFKYFPSFYDQAFYQHSVLCDDEELGVRVQAIRGLPFFCKDTPEYLSKTVDFLGQLLMSAGENVERDSVQKALMALLRQDIKTSLTVLFKFIGGAEGSDSDESVATRGKILCFIRDKVFPLKAELLKPQEQMERHMTDLVKNSIQNITESELKMFVDFLQSLSLFGVKASAERMQELAEIIEGWAYLGAGFDVSDVAKIDRLISCIRMVIPLYKRGASDSRFLSYFNKFILPGFDKLPEMTKEDLLKNFAECSHYGTPEDSRQLLPSIVQLLKKHMTRRKVEEVNFTSIESLLYIFHHLSHKTPNATNSLCGYKFVTGQPSDRLGEDFSDLYHDFTERLKIAEDLAKAMTKKVMQGMAEHNKALAAAKTVEEKSLINVQKQNATSRLRSCNNVLAMTKPLHSKVPSFIGDKKINLSWKENVRPLAPSSDAVTGKKRAAATNASSRYASKKGRGGSVGVGQSLLVNKALEVLTNGGGNVGKGDGRSRKGRGSGRGRGRGSRRY